jgi:hypothetical protein
MMCVPLEVRIGRDLFDDDTADSPGFGIPLHVITNLKFFGITATRSVKSAHDILTNAGLC